MCSNNNAGNWITGNIVDPLNESGPQQKPESPENNEKSNEQWWRKKLKPKQPNMLMPAGDTQYVYVNQDGAAATDDPNKLLGPVQRRKPRSLLSLAGAAGDTSAANIGAPYAKPTLGG